MSRAWCAFLCFIAIVVATIALNACEDSKSNAQEYLTCVVVEPTPTPKPTPKPAATPKATPAPTPAPTPEPTPEPEPEPAYTEEELEMLAIVIYREAGADYCSDETRMMVGNVVLNRVADDRFPNTIYEVLTEYRQYGRMYWTGVVWPKRASKEVEAHAVERAYECAKRLLEGERVLPDDVVWQAEFRQGKEVVAHQDGMYFCR